MRPPLLGQVLVKVRQAQRDYCESSVAGDTRGAGDGAPLNEPLEVEWLAEREAQSVQKPASSAEAFGSGPLAQQGSEDRT